MNQDAHRKLVELASATGMEYGKLVQKLLAVAFCESGAVRVTERSIQGIDLEVVLKSGDKAAFEVKTAQAGKVRFGKKDIDGLAARRIEGFEPYFALLGSGLLDDWIFARCFPAEIQPQRDYLLTRLRAYRDRALEKIVRETFPEAVRTHAGTAVEGGQDALNEVLKNYSCYALA